MDYSTYYQPSAPPLEPTPPNVVIMASPQIQLGPDPITMTCPYCSTVITTDMEMSASMRTHFFFIILCAFGCCCCAPFAYCTNSCLAKKHTCPSCSRFLGVYDK